MLSNRPDLHSYTKLLSQSPGWIAGQVEVTSQCSQLCNYCSSWREDYEAHSQWTFSKLVDFCIRIAEVFPGFEHLTLTGGEPQDWPWLEEFLRWYNNTLPRKFALQVSTTLCKPVSNPILWRQAIRDVRVSLDAVDPTIYEQVRGVQVDPEQVLRNIAALDHPRTAIIVTLYPESINHFPDIFWRLQNFAEDGPGIRRIMVLPGMGLARDKQSVGFLRRWRELVDAYSGSKPLRKADFRGPGIPTSFAEDPFAVRTQPDLLDVPCYVGASTFHIKSNGDLYPCCLVGGEAIGTREEYRLGNVWETPLEVLWRQHKTPFLRYAIDGFCKTGCFWKQLALNVETHKAKSYCLSMP